MRACTGILGVAVLLGGSLAHAGQPPQGPAVLELFTSEGCSSCPPAEAVLTALTAREDVITLGFHVTYWDELGWRDRFGLPEATDRQRHYVASLGLAGAYTPEAIINGRASVVGSDRRAVERMIRGLPRPAAIGMSHGAQKAVLRLPAMSVGECPCELLLLGVTAEASTTVVGGENRGRLLRASSIVRSITHAGSWQGGAEVRNVALPPRARDVGSLVALAQRSRDGAVMAAGRVVVATYLSAAR